jgi:hypothetical protein
VISLRPAITATALALLACLGQRVRAQEAPDPPPLVIETMQCRGNVSTSCKSILSYIFLNPGDVIDEEEIQNAKLRMAWLPNFEAVDIYLEKGSERGKARLIVEVVEGDAIRTEGAFGFASRDSLDFNVIEARISNWNLSGEGRVLHFGAGVATPLGEPELSQKVVNLQYVEPQLFGSKKYYANAIAFWNDTDSEDRFGNRVKAEHAGVELMLGRRLWDFSFISAGYQFRPLHDFAGRFRQRDGSFEDVTNSPGGLMVFRFGWHSEDDPYFPTSGSWLSFDRFSSSSDDADEEWEIFYRRTWRTKGNSLWTFHFESDGNFSVAFARPIGASDLFGGIRRGRWYLQPLLNEAGIDERGRQLHEVGLRAGIRLDTKWLGVVDLFVVGTRSTDVGFLQ